MSAKGKCARYRTGSRIFAPPQRSYLALQYPSIVIFHDSEPRGFAFGHPARLPGVRSQKHLSHGPVDIAMAVGVKRAVRAWLDGTVAAESVQKCSLCYAGLLL
jgi:hypothetical protein